MKGGAKTRNEKVIRASKQVTCCDCGGGNGTLVKAGNFYRHQYPWMCRAHREAVAIERRKRAALKEKATPEGK